MKRKKNKSLGKLNENESKVPDNDAKTYTHNIQNTEYEKPKHTKLILTESHNNNEKEGVNIETIAAYPKKPNEKKNKNSFTHTHVSVSEKMCCQNNHQEK